MENNWWRISSTSCHLIGILVTAMQLTTTTTSHIHYHKLKIHVLLISGSVGYLISFWTSQRLIHFWFYATLSNVAYYGMECLRYWSFVRSLSGKLLTIYTLGNGGGELFTDSIHRLITAPNHARRYQNRKWICTEKLPIRSTSEDLNVGESKYLLSMHPRSVYMHWL